MNAESFESRIRAVLTQHARMTQDPQVLDSTADLYEGGMTSHASVNVMLALEEVFELEFPDHLLKRSVFGSIAAIAQALQDIRAAKVGT